MSRPAPPKGPPPKNRINVNIKDRIPRPPPPDGPPPNQKYPYLGFKNIKKTEETEKPKKEKPKKEKKKKKKKKKKKREVKTAEIKGNIHLFTRLVKGYADGYLINIKRNYNDIKIAQQVMEIFDKNLPETKDYEELIKKFRDFYRDNPRIKRLYRNFFKTFKKEYKQYKEGDDDQRYLQLIVKTISNFSDISKIPEDYKIYQNEELDKFLKSFRKTSSNSGKSRKSDGLKF